MKNDKSVGLFSLSLNFSGLLLDFSGLSLCFLFIFFQIFKKIKSNRPVFGKPIKPVRSDFTVFHENRLVFVDIVDHVTTYKVSGVVPLSYLSKLTISLCYFS
jgi:hypothetical protein